MIQSIYNDRNYELAKKMLDASAVRQEALVANIANAETPGYHRVDLDPNFSKHLQALLDTGDTSVAMPKLMEDKVTAEVRPDGNNVEIDKELLLLNQNTVEHGFLANFLTSNIRMMRTAITGRNA